MGERPGARPSLLLVQAFVNTLDLDLRTDVLAHTDEARAAWPRVAQAARGRRIRTSPRISS